MSAGHFFVGLGAGIAILSLPVMMLMPGSTVPERVIDWIMGPDPEPKPQIVAEDSAANRPLHGYRPGDPTPAAATAPPTIEPLSVATAAPTPAPIVDAPPLNTLRWQSTAVIHSNGAPVYVRRVAGIDSRDDPVIPDSSPVLVSSGPPLQVGAQQWRAIRGLNGVVGWVLGTQLTIDGEVPPAAPTSVPAATAAPSAAANRGVIANTDGAGVVLRNSPNDADRTRSGLMDGAGVTVLESSGSDWLHVRADNGQTGWVPARYVAGS
jgi:SH3-like domain-containing protein